MSERDMTRVGNEAHTPAATGPQLLNSKSVPTLHHIGEFKMFLNAQCKLFHENYKISFTGNAGNKSRSVHNLTGPSNSAGNINQATDQGFYQNLSVYRQQNQSQPNLGEK